jgi:hypothetical protein
MITGYNTDVPHSNVVYHVQTEDKGTSAACIESLIYVGGQILAKRQSSYKGAVQSKRGKQAVVDLMDHQHRLMIAEIRSGKYDEKVARLTGAAAPEQVAKPPLEGSTPTRIAHDIEVGSPVDSAAEMPATPAVADDKGKGLEEGPSLDQIIMEYLSAESEQEALILMMDADRDINLGETVDLSFRTKASLSGKAVRETQIRVKMISTVREPSTLASGKTDDRGELRMTLEIPDLKRGSSALIVTATSDIGTAEIKHLL